MQKSLIIFDDNAEAKATKSKVVVTGNTLTLTAKVPGTHMNGAKLTLADQASLATPTVTVTNPGTASMVIAVKADLSTTNATLDTIVPVLKANVDVAASFDVSTSGTTNTTITDPIGTTGFVLAAGADAKRLGMRAQDVVCVESTTESSVKIIFNSVTGFSTTTASVVVNIDTYKFNEFVHYLNEADEDGAIIDLNKIQHVTSIGTVTYYS